MSLLLKRFKYTRAVATAAALCFALMTISFGNAYAHKIYVGASHIVWNSDKSLIEVEHSLLWHDLESALTVRSGKRFSFDQGDDVSIPLVKEYVQDRFIIEVDGAFQPLEWVGMKFNTDKINIMYQAKLDKAPSKLLVLNGLMTDVFETHKNKVIIEAYGETHSFDLTRKNVEAEVDLTK